MPFTKLKIQRPLKDLFTKDLSHSPKYLCWSIFLLIEEASCQHFLTESYNIWAVTEVEMLVSPELPSRATPSLNLIHDQGYIMLQRWKT